ncbi:MAG: hypothetical protein LAO30_01035 [Acidobacteriia bacterium]|nr:hypothetical protein [Terriglobia bacterium]
MLKTIISCALVLGAAVSPALKLAEGQEQPVKPTLSVSVRSAKLSYGIKEKFQLQIQVENLGGESLLVWRHVGWGVGRMDVRVFDSNGKEVFTTFLADEVPPMPREDDFIVLEGGEFFGNRVSEDATHFVNTPGTYDIFVEYTSSLPEQYLRKNLRLPNLPLWSRERGTIASNKIRIEVTK